MCDNSCCYEYTLHTALSVKSPIIVSLRKSIPSVRYFKKRFSLVVPSSSHSAYASVFCSLILISLLLVSVFVGIECWISTISPSTVFLLKRYPERGTKGLFYSSLMFHFVPCRGTVGKNSILEYIGCLYHSDYVV